MAKTPLQDHQRMTIKSKSDHSESPIKPLSEEKKVNTKCGGALRTYWTSKLFTNYGTHLNNH
ncbi:protein of unknown function [Vibrio tapetis subsp. tapetis]|uniref:Uncharacterized protein n=1 Tax=Vibrio tapetis subsp. tapetis TaxID=1671868 RepID=A0A2N8ZI85_9VIBR|nr:protein of unknown function [Vibrio tapetis subsp. tapetis]